MEKVPHASCHVYMATGEANDITGKVGTGGCVILQAMLGEDRHVIQEHLMTCTKSASAQPRSQVCSGGTDGMLHSP